MAMQNQREVEVNASEKGNRNPDESPARIPIIQNCRSMQTTQHPNANMIGSASFAGKSQSARSGLNAKIK